MGASDSTTWIAAHVAQRRVALLLLPLRIWLGLGWLRAGLSKLPQPEWFDGTAFNALVHGQAQPGATPVAAYTDLLAGSVDSLAVPLGMVIVFGEIAIGLGLLTGTLTNLALLTAVLFNVNFILAGSASPNQFYIVIELVLLAGGAGAYYSVDRRLSRYLKSSLFTGHRGLVDGVDAPRSALALLAVACVGLAAAALPTVRAVLPQQGADDPGYTLVALLAVTALLALALTRAVHRVSEVPTANDLITAGRPANGVLPSPVGQQRPANGVSPPLAGQRVTDNGAPAGRPVLDNGVGPSARRRPPLPAAPDGHRAPLPAAGMRPEDGLPAPRRRPAEQWMPPAPPEEPIVTRAAPRDQPTTQFARPQRRRRVADRNEDPYAELRELPPAPPDRHYS